MNPSPSRSGRHASLRRLRLGFALVSVAVAALLCAVLAALATLRGLPLAALAPAWVGIALGLLAEMLCLDLAVRRACARMPGFAARPGDPDGAPPIVAPR